MEEQIHERRDQLVKHTPKISELRMREKQIDREIVLVADAMSKIEKVAMYDKIGIQNQQKIDETEE